MSDTPSAPLSVFRATLPVTLTSFVNKCGDIGIRFFPMLVVELGLHKDQSSLILTLVKLSTFAAVFFGGVLSDKRGLAYTVQLSFILCAAGLAILAGSTDAVIICGAGMLAAFGQGLFMAPSRMLLFKIVPEKGRREGLAWFRALNNGAIMLANFIASMIAGLGLVALFAFDAFTSVLAFLLGRRLLPKDTGHRFSNADSQSSPNQQAQELTSEHSHKSTRKEWTRFIYTALLCALFSCLGEIFFVATAAQARITFGEHGVRLYSQIYMINTGLCMVFAVVAARLMKHVTAALILGVLFEAGAIILFLYHKEQEAYYFISTLLQTVGEVLFTSVSLFLLIQSIPKSQNQGRIYSTALLVQNSGKVFGAGAAMQALESPAYASIGVLLLSAFAVFAAMAK
jgi:MFS family permease